MLRNAIIHSDSKSINIELKETGFTLTDFGQGISEEMLNKMFERYTNGHTDSNQGIGIGLSLVKRLCDHYSWILDVDSTQGIGTSITINFNEAVTT